MIKFYMAEFVLSFETYETIAIKKKTFKHDQLFVFMSKFSDFSEIAKFSLSKGTRLIENAG